MSRPQSKVDMAAMNAAIDKVLAYKPPPKAEQKKLRAQRSKAKRPLPPKASKNTIQPAVR